MADNAEVLRRINRHNGISYSVLTPNLKGFQAAVSFISFLIHTKSIVYITG